MNRNNELSIILNQLAALTRLGKTITARKRDAAKPQGAMRKHKLSTYSAMTAASLRK